MKNKLLFYPQNLNIHDVIDKDDVLSIKQKEQAHKYYQRVLYPVSKILTEYKLNKSFKDEIIDNLYVKLNSNILLSIFSSKAFYWIIPFLLRNKIIIKNKNNYSTSNYSNSYRIGDKYISKYYKEEIIRDETLLYNLRNNDLDLTNDINKKLYNNLSKIKIDAIKAIELLNKKLGENIINNNYINTYTLMFPKNDGSQLDDVPDWLNYYFIFDYIDSVRDMDLIRNKEAMEVFNNWVVNISKIVDGDFFIKKGKNSGRIFTNLTSLPREIRECLYIDDPNKGLVEVDICNSQPLLFNYFLLENFNLEDDIFGDKYEDIRLYIKLTSNGEFYEYLMKEWNIEDRGTFKKNVFGSIFYCRKSSNFRNDYSIKFSKMFPNVMSLILKMKEGNYKNLPIQLQKLEADIIIKGVSSELNNIWFSTIHDSVLCYEEDYEMVKDCVVKHINKLGLNPKIKNK